MKLYLFAVCMVTTPHLLFKIVMASPGLYGFNAITHIGLCQSISTSLRIVYCGIFCSHSAMLTKRSITFGFIGDAASANGSALPSPPRDYRSFLSITMSYLRTYLYLFVLGLALMGVDIMLVKHGIPHHLFTSLCPILYFLGILSYTVQIFDFRTNLILMIICAELEALNYNIALGVFGMYLMITVMSLGVKPAGGVVAVTSTVPVVAGASTASVETGTGQNLETRRNPSLTGSDSAVNQQDGGLVANAAAGIIYTPFIHTENNRRESLMTSLKMINHQYFIMINKLSCILT